MSGPRGRAVLNLVLLALACGLGAFIWLTASSPKPAAARLTDLDIGQVSKLRVQRHGRAALTLHRSDAGWRLVAPVELPADPARVEALLGLARARVHEAFRAAGNDLSEFGLEPPVARVWLDDLEIDFGDTESLNGWRYVLVGPDVHLITDAFFHHLLATPVAFADPSLVSAGRQPTAVLVSAPVLRMLGEDGASGLPGGDLRHSSAAHLAAWSNARASGVRALDPSRSWVDGVEIALSGELKLRFRVADGDHELLFARPDWQLQYHVPRAAARRLLLSASEP